MTFAHIVGVSDLGGTLAWFRPAITGAKAYPIGLPRGGFNDKMLAER